MRFGGSATDSEVLCFKGFGFKVFGVCPLDLIVFSLKLQKQHIKKRTKTLGAVGLKALKFKNKSCKKVVRK